MRDAVIVSAVRTPVGKAPRGTLRSTRPDDLGAIAVRGALDRLPQLDAREIEDVIIGCAFPEAEQGMNMARVISLRAGLPVVVSRHDHQQAIALPGCSPSRWPPSAFAEAAPKSSLPAALESMSIDPDGRQQDRRQSLAGRKLSRLLSLYGSDCRARREEIRHLA